MVLPERGFMKALVLAFSIFAGISQAHARSEVPFYGCKLRADLVETKESVEAFIVRSETVVGYGVSECTDLRGRKVTQNVTVQLESGGVGLAFNGPLQGLTVLAARAGVAGVTSMEGVYDFSVGPRLGLIDSRESVMAGIQINGPAAGVGIEAVIENRLSLGLDFGGMKMVVKAVGRSVRPVRARN